MSEPDPITGTSTAKNLTNNMTITQAKKQVMNRAAKRNLIRANKGFSRQTRDREFPNYQPYENAGGGMNRHYERAAQKEADEALAKVVADGSN